MKIEIIKCLVDNYSYLIIDQSNGFACVVDPSEPNPIIKYIEDNQINLNIYTKYSSSFRSYWWQ